MIGLAANYPKNALIPEKELSTGLNYLAIQIKKKWDNTGTFAKQGARVVLFLCACLWLSPVIAQLPQAASSTAVPLINAFSPEDTLPLLYTLANAPEQSVYARDTMPDQEFRLYDPARKSPIDAGHLGNLGSASRNLWFSPAPRIGFESGFRAFNLYKITPNDLAFYRHARTYSHAYFSRGRSQRDAESWIKFSRTFSGGLNFSLQYKTINNLGSYRYQRTKHNSLAAGFWMPVKKKYEFFLIYASNTFQQQDNGGILDPLYFGSEFYSGMISVPVFLDEDNSKVKNTKHNLQFSQYYTFSKTAKRVFRAEHSINYKTEIWKYSDVNSDSSDDAAIEQLFYGNLFTDVRGLRHFVRVDRIDNDFLLNTLPSKADSTTKNNRLALGLKHALIWVGQEPRPDSLFNNLFLTGRFTFAPSRRISLVANGDLGMLPQNGYRLTSALRLDIGKAGVIEASVLSQLHPPDLVQSKVYATAQPVYNLNFKSVLENTVAATWSIPQLGVSVYGATHLVNQYIYFDATGLPQQIGSPVQVAQLMVRKNFKLGILRSENTVGLQQINNNEVLRLPNWFSKNSLYVSRRYFKKQLLATYGVDFRINSEFRPDAYQPFLGQFYLQPDTLTQVPFPWIDAFLAVKIEKFRLFLRFENLATIWEPAENLFLTYNQPQTQFTFRLGISWRFLDSNKGGEGNNSGLGTGGGGRPPVF